MFDDIVLITKTYIRAHIDNFSHERDAKETDVNEVNALVGLLLMAGL